MPQTQSQDEQDYRLRKRSVSTRRGSTVTIPAGAIEIETEYEEPVGMGTASGEATVWYLEPVEDSDEGGEADE